MRPTPLEVRDHPACRPVARLCSATLSRAEHATEPGHTPPASAARRQRGASRWVRLTGRAAKSCNYYAMHDVDHAVHCVDAMVSTNSVSLDTAILSSLLTTASLARAVSPRPASHSPQVSWRNTTPASGRAYGRFGLDNAFLGWVWRSVLVSSRVLSENSARAEGTELAKNTYEKHVEEGEDFLGLGEQGTASWLEATPDGRLLPGHTL